MNKIRKRNEQILSLTMAGSSPAELAHKFGISVGGVRKILKAFEVEGKLAERRACLREQIRQADDLDQKWAVLDLLDAIGLVVVTRKRLLDHYEACGVNLISLRDLMEAFSERQDPATGYFFAPILRIRGVGKIGFWSVANGLSAMDLGPRCQHEWSRRLAAIERNWGIRSATPYWGHNPADAIESETMRRFLDRHREGSPSEGFAI